LRAKAWAAPRRMDAWRSVRLNKATVHSVNARVYTE
jgi:hypothetical protein